MHDTLVDLEVIKRASRLACRAPVAAQQPAVALGGRRKPRAPISSIETVSCTPPTVPAAKQSSAVAQCLTISVSP